MSKSAPIINEIVDFVTRQTTVPDKTPPQEPKPVAEEKTLEDLNFDLNPPFKPLYTKLSSLNEQSTLEDVQPLIVEITTTFASLFDYSKLRFVTKESNATVFKVLTNLIAAQTGNHAFQASGLNAIRILSRSRLGVTAIITPEFHQLLIAGIRSDNEPLMTQALACLTNCCIITLENVNRFAVKFHTGRILADLLMTDTLSDNLLFLSLHCLFYLTVEKQIGQKLYENTDFFKWCFTLFLRRTEAFNDPSFWNIHNPLNFNATTQKNRVIEDGKIITEMLRVLFNFTMVEKNVIKFKLDKFDNTFTKTVVFRAVSLLNLPLHYEPRFNLQNYEACAELLDCPGLIAIKMGLCNVAIYDGDILAMNLRPSAAEPLAELLEFKVMNSRADWNAQKTICPLLMFLTATCKYNHKVRYRLKRYIFGALADPPDDEDSDNDQPQDQAPMNPPRLDENDTKDAITLKNVLLKHMTSVDYAVKRSVGEFFFAMCAEQPNEMIRITGMGNAIGTLVDKGLPGFAGMANNAMDLSQLAGFKRAHEAKEAAKKKEGDGGGGGDSKEEKE